MPIYDDDLMADLATMDEEFVDAAPAERRQGGNNVPNGSYQATVDKLYFDRSKDGTKIMLKWELVIAAGEYAGERLFRNNMTATPDNQRWLKADLMTAGLDTDGLKLSEVPQHLDGLLDVLLEVSVKRNGAGDDERVNVYINRRVEIDDAPAAGGRGGAARDTAAKRPAGGGAGSGTATSRAQGGSSRGLSRF